MTTLFADLGLPAPQPVHRLPAPLQIEPIRYTDAATGLDVLPTLEGAVAWSDDYLQRLAIHMT